MLISFDTKEELLRFVASDQTGTEYLLLGGFQRLKRWCALPLKPLTFLYGPNSAGKGAAIDAQNLIRLLWKQGAPSISRWHRNEAGISLSVGLSSVVPLYDMYFGDDSHAFEQYSRHGGDHPEFWSEFFNDDIRMDPQRLTWIASWEFATSQDPSHELFVGDQRAAALLVDKGGDGQVFVRRDALELVLGRPLHEFKMFSGLKNFPAPGNSSEFLLTNLDGMSWALSEFPTCYNSKFDGERFRDLRYFLVVVFASLPKLGRYRSAYVGPIRRILSNDELVFRGTGNPNFPDVVANSPVLGKDGDGSSAWLELAKEMSKSVLSGAFYAENTGGTCSVLDEVNRWLDSPQCFDSGYSVTVDVRLIIPTSSVNNHGILKKKSVIENKEVEANLRFGLRDREGRQHTLEDVGTGWSQVIPVIISALHERYGSLAFFEQPELHLHPKLQTVLCDLFIDALNGSRKRKYGAGNMIIESHSEHILLRLLRRIRETSTADIQHTRFSITPDDVAVLYFEPEGDETFVHNIRISPDGTFADRWPKGFFDERFEEVFSE